jgi:hypothetical protein
VSYFSPPKNDRQLTTFTTHFTTNSPQNNHVYHPLFPKNPSKIPQSAIQIKSCLTPQNSTKDKQTRAPESASLYEDSHPAK